MKNSMRVAVLHQQRDLRFEEIPKPEINADEVLVKIKANGICGSDIHFYEKGELGPFKVTEPYVPGHESAGKIVETGREVTKFSVNDRVVIEPGISCRRCEYCKTGKYNLCPDVKFLSAPPVDGTLSEYAAVPSDFVFGLADSMDYKAGALVEPAAVGVHSCNRAQITAGMKVAVLGVGPIGLLTLQSAQAFGATEIYAVDIIEERLQLAKNLGASHTINAEKSNLEEKIMELTAQEGVHIVFETAGSTKTAQTAVGIARRGGKVIHVGWTDPGQFSYDIETLMEKELDVRGVNRYANAFSRAINLMEAGNVQVKPLITHQFKFTNVVDAFDYISNNKTEVIKAVIES